MTLRDGETVRVRELDPSIDGEALRALELDIHRALDGVVMTPEEAAARSAEQWVEGLPRGERGIALVAEAEGALIAQTALRREKLVQLQHVVTLEIAVHPDWQGRGLGRLLMQHLLAWADAAEPAVERVELRVRADNQRAIALYRSCGFEQEGLRRNFLRLPDGSFVDDVLMARLHVPA